MQSAVSLCTSENSAIQNLSIIIIILPGLPCALNAKRLYTFSSYLPLVIEKTINLHYHVTVNPSYWSDKTPIVHKWILISLSPVGHCLAPQRQEVELELKSAAVTERVLQGQDCEDHPHGRSARVPPIVCTNKYQIQFTDIKRSFRK